MAANLLTSRSKILVQRTGGLGDVILITPVLQRLQEEHPDSTIQVRTAWPQVFIGSCWQMDDGLPADMTYNLDLAYERSPRCHVVDAYFMHVFGDRSGEKQQVLHAEPAGHRFDVILHAGTSWPSRTLPQKTWDETVFQLVTNGLSVAAIGRYEDHHPSLSEDMRERLSIQQVVGLISGARCFVGIDSAPLHMAGATQTPIVGVFTCAKAEYRLPYRPNLGDKCVAIVPELDCYGCLADYRPPVIGMSCRRYDNACVHMIQTNTIADAVKSVT
jgi:ADP-heptose:LPS heptosyltransferase